MPKFGKRRFRGHYRATSKKGRRQLFPKKALPARQQFADQIGGYALNKGDTVKTNLKIFLDPEPTVIGQIVGSGNNEVDLATQYTVKLSRYGALNDDYRLITAAWQRYRIVGATMFAGQPYTWTTSGRQYYDSTVYIAVLKKAITGRVNTATLRGLENCEFKLMTASNDVIRKRMKYPAVPVETAIAGSTAPEAYKNMWLQTTDDGATVPHYSFMLGTNIQRARTLPAGDSIYMDTQVQLELQLDRPNYQNNNVSHVKINPEKPTQRDLDHIEALYQKHFCKNEPEESESEEEDIPPYDVPLCVKLLKPPAEKIRARAQSAASA